MRFASRSVTYDLIRHFTADDLNELASGRRDATGNTLFDNFKSPTNNLSYIPATRGATLYKVWYEIPTETTFGPQTLSGLIAIPDPQPGGNISTTPLASYIHGTVFRRDAVPSNVIFKSNDAQGIQGWDVGSGETLFNICQLASQGYALIAADYVGLGTNTSPEGYVVKDITNAAIQGMLEASISVLSDLDVHPEQLFLNGWSQGAMNTQWATQNFESLGIPIAASAVQSPFNDLTATFKWWLGQSLKTKEESPGQYSVIPGDPAPWLPLCAGLVIGSYQNWYGLNGLLESLVKTKVIPDRQIDGNGNIIDDPSTYTYNDNPRLLTYYDVIKGWIDDYESISFGDSSGAIQFSNLKWAVRVQDGYDENGAPLYAWTTVPGFTGKEMISKDIFSEYISPIVSDFLRKLSANTPRYWDYATPLRAWYGLADEALPSDFVSPDLQIYGGPNVSLVPVTNGSHRATFLNSLYASSSNPGGTSQNIIEWFASHLSPGGPKPTLALSENRLIASSKNYGVLPISLECVEYLGTQPLVVEIQRQRADGSTDVLRTIGATTASAGQLQFLGANQILLQTGDRLAFRLLSPDSQRVIDHTAIIKPIDTNGSYLIDIRPSDLWGASMLRFRLTTEDTGILQTILGKISAPQSGADDAYMQLSKGQILNLELSTDCTFRNTLAFIRINQDPVTGMPLGTVGIQDIPIQSEAFRQQVNSLIAPGFKRVVGGERAFSGASWTVEEDGLYAPLLMTQDGNIYTVGSSPESSHLRVFGQNSFGFEDMTASRSDWDWNDVIIKVTSAS